MDGLMAYRQYLENIRMSVQNLELPTLEKKDFISIIEREKEFKDLAYIDVILKNAGLDLSFLGDKEFLNKKVVVKSKLDKYFIKENDNLSDVMKGALSDYMSMFVSDEDEIIDSLEEIHNNMEEVSLNYFPQSSTYYSPEEFVEKHKDALHSLFSGLEKVKKEEKEKVEESKEEVVEEFFDEDFLFDSDNDLVDTEFENNETTENIESVENTESAKSLNNEEINKEENESNTKEIEDIELDRDDIQDIDFDVDTSFLMDDSEEEKEDDNVEDSDDAFDKNIDDIFDSDENDDFETDIDGIKDKDFNTFLESDDIEDNTGELLKDDLFDEDDFKEDMDPISDVTDYFLNGKANQFVSEDLKAIYKSKEKIVNSPEITNTDDAVAKAMLVLTDGIISFPKVTGNIFKKAKKGAKKIHENLIVEGDEDDSE